MKKSAEIKVHIKNNIGIGVQELGSGVSGQHGNDCNLAPLIHVSNEVAQLPEMSVYQVYSVRTNFLECHHNTAGYKLKIYNV